MALAPRTLYLAAAAGQVPFVAFVGVALLRLCAADPSHFLLGRLHGPWAAAALDRRRPRRGGTVRRPARRRRLARLWDRLGLALVALSPSGKVLVLAGASRLTHRRVAAAAVAGTLVQVVLLYVAGRAVSGTVEAGAGVMAAWAPAVVLVTLGIVAGAAVRRTSPATVGGSPFSAVRWCSSAAAGSGRPPAGCRRLPRPTSSPWPWPGRRRSRPTDRRGGGPARPACSR